MKKNDIKKPSLPAEVFLSVCKIFLMIVIANNLVWWAAVRNSGTHTRVETTQDGRDNVMQDVLKNNR